MVRDFHDVIGLLAGKDPRRFETPFVAEGTYRAPRPEGRADRGDQEEAAQHNERGLRPDDADQKPEAEEYDDCSHAWLFARPFLGDAGFVDEALRGQLRLATFER